MPKLQRVKEVIEKGLKTPRAPEKYLLAQRLSQCIAKGRPHGLHHYTLQIYEIILVQGASELFQEDIAIYSAGLFPFFKYASYDNKRIVLKLINEIYLPLIREQKIPYVLPGLVVSILPALNDDANQEFSDLVMMIFKDIAACDRRGLYGAIWLAVLRTPKVRLGALRFLKKMPKPEVSQIDDDYMPHRAQTINALVECLEDENLIQRMALDFLKSHCPLFEIQALQENEKVVLLEACLKIFKKGEYAKVRRVCEWANLDSDDRDEIQLFNLMEILVPAIKNQFAIKPENESEALVPMTILDQLLENASDIQDTLMTKIAVIILQYSRQYYQGYDFSEKMKWRTQQLLESHPRSVWKALNQHLEQHFLNQHLEHDFLETIDLIKFTFELMPLSTCSMTSHITYKELIELVNQLMNKIADLESNDMLETMKLLDNIISNIDDEESQIQLPKYDFFEFFKEKLDPTQVPQLKMASKLCIRLEAFGKDQPGIWLKHVTDEIARAQDHKINMVGYECIADLMTLEEEKYKPAQQQVKESVVKQITQNLYTRILHEKAAVGLLLKLRKGCPDILSDTMAESLKAESNDELVTGIRQFNYLWKQLSVDTDHPENLPEIFQSGDALFIMIEQLESKSPIVRHSARQWLVDSIKRFNVVVDPLLKILMNQDTKRYKGQLDMLYYQNKYDTEKILDALQKLKSLIVVGGDNVAQFMGESEVSQSIKDLLNDAHGVHEELWNPTTYKTSNINSRNLGPEANVAVTTWPRTYRDFVLVLSMLFIQGNHEENVGQFSIEQNETVQAATCELLEIVLRRVTVKQAHNVIGPILKTLNHVIKNNPQSIMQLLLLNLLQVILYQTEFTKDRDGTTAILSQTEFESVYLKSGNTNDSYIRSYWINFKIITLELLVQFLSGEVLERYISELLNSFFHLIEENQDTELVFAGLTAIVHYALALANPESLALDNPELFYEHPTAEPSSRKNGFFSQIWSTLTGKIEYHDFLSDNRFTAVPLIIFKEQNFDNLLKTCMMRIDPLEHCQNLTEKGIAPFVYNKQIKTESDIAEKQKKILDLLSPIAKQFPDKLVRSAINMWINFLSNPNDTTESDLNKLMLLLVNLPANLQTILSSVEKYVMKISLRPKQRKTRNQEENHREIAICHFLYSLLSFYDIRSSSYPIPLVKKLWLIMIRILQQIQFNPRLDVNLWILELIQIFSERVNPKDVIRFKKIRKDMQNLVPKVTNELNQFNEFSDLEYPLPPTIYAKQDQYPPKLYGLMTLNRILFPVVHMVWQPENTDKITQHIQVVVTPMMQRVLKDESDPQVVELVSELLVNILEKGGTYLAKVFRLSIIEIFADERFFEMLKFCPASIPHWREIAKKITMFCYHADKNAIITEFVSRVPGGVFVPRQKELDYRKKALKQLCFMIYSGETDDFQSSMEMLIDMLKDYLSRNEEILPTIIFTLRIMMLKLSQDAISEIWDRIWPHIFTELFTIFNNPESKNDLQVEGMKLIELISTLNIQEYHNLSWIFFYDVVEVDPTYNEGFCPLIPKLAYHGQDPLRVESVEDLFLGRKESRSLKVTKTINFEEQRIQLIKCISESNVKRTEPDLESIEQVIENDFTRVAVKFG